MGFATGGGGAALIVALGVGVAVAACSEGDKSSDGECARGARCGPGTDQGAVTGAGAGSGAAGDDTTAGAAGSFGNTTATPPNLMGIDAGEPGVGETTEADNPLCGGLEVEPEIMMEVIPGNILLIFDKSGSMCDTWGTSASPKWQDAHSAVAAAIEPLKENVKVGVIFFPDTPTAPEGDNGCFVPPFNAAPQIEFTDGTSFLTTWTNYWGFAMGDPMTCGEPPDFLSEVPANAVDGATPLLPALQVADTALASAGLMNTTSIVIITDGQPNCTAEGSNREESLANLMPPIAAWLTAGYKTYVVGLPGGRDQQETDRMIATLNGLAVAGGTTQYIPANDPATLQMNLAMIIGQSVTSSFTTCEIGLPEVPPDPNKVNVVVVEGGIEQLVAADLGTGGGWMLSPDNTSITLHGPLCDLAMLGQYEKISVVFGCVDLPPLEPPSPPE